MTYRQLFSQANFSILLDADFCIIVTDDISHYLLYRYSTEMCCYALGFFQDVTINDLKFLYNVKDDGDTQDEYILENIISKEKVLSYIFSLIDIERDNKTLKNIFKKDIYSNNVSGEFALILKSTEKKHKIVNILSFNKNTFQTVFGNKNCYWQGGGEGVEKAAIAWCPFSLHNFLSDNNNNFSSYILIKDCDNHSLKASLVGNYKEYNIITSSVDDSVEAMRFIISAINIFNGTTINFHHNSTMIEIEIPLTPEEEILQWVQIISNVMKKIRQLYYDSKGTNFEYIKQYKQTVHGRNHLYLSFVKARPLINLLCNTFIDLFNLNIKIINTL